MKKNWLEKQDDYRREFSAWDDLKFTLSPPLLIVLGVLSIGAVVVGLALL